MPERTTRTADAQCPHCHAPISAAASLEGATPKPGDFSVCLLCTGILVFTAEMTPRAPTAAEAEEFLADPECRKMRGLIERHRALRRPRIM